MERLSVGHVCSRWNAPDFWIRLKYRTHSFRWSSPNRNVVVDRSNGTALVLIGHAPLVTVNQTQCLTVSSARALRTFDSKICRYSWDQHFAENVFVLSRLLATGAQKTYTLSILPFVSDFRTLISVTDQSINQSTKPHLDAQV